MKPNTCLLRGSILALCLLATVSACSQEAKKPRKQASVKETVYQPEQEDKKATTVKKAEPTAKAKKSAKAKKAAKAEAKQPSPQQKKAALQEGKAKTQQKKPAASKKKPAAKKEKHAASTQKRAKAETAKKKPAATKPKEKRPAARKQKPEAIPSARYVAVKTNVPFLAVAVQNLAVEVQLARHISLDLPVMWSISDIERRHALRTIALQPEARWWLKSVGTGHFFGVHAHAAWFNVKWEDDRYQTEKRPLIGAGLSYGYKLPLSAHWGAEFNVGAGYANMQYNTYYNLDNGAWIDTRTRHYWGITRAGISLVYRF